MKKKILLTGANGFVGIQILKNLLLKDVELTVIIRSQSVKKFKKSKKIKKIIESSDMFSESIECSFVQYGVRHSFRAELMSVA